MTASALFGVGPAKAQAADEANAATPARELPASAAPARQQELSFAGAHLAGGVVWLADRDPGGYARIAGDLYSRSGHAPAGIWGMWHGFEGWSIPDGFGLGLPVVGYGGVQLGHVFGALGAGANLVHIDEVNDNFGFGVLSPRGGARLGFELGQLRVVATWDLQWRWSWGGADLAVFQAGLAIGFASDIPPK